MRFSQSQSLWLLSGLILRTGLLFWGIHQDSTSVLPYTDVDYSVFNQATNTMVHGCQIQNVLSQKNWENSNDNDDGDGHGHGGRGRGRSAGTGRSRSNDKDSTSTSHLDGIEFQDWQDLKSPKGFQCAQGFLPSLARFTLLNDPRIKLNQEAARQHTSNPHKEREIVNSIFHNKDSFEYKWTMFCYDLIRPLFLQFATLGNPFERLTFRYTPVLSLILSPSQLSWFPLGPSYYGKLLFVISDLLLAVLMWDLLDGRRDRTSSLGANDHLVGILWLLNPFVAQISTRGSSETLLGLLILSFLALFLRFNPEVPIEFLGNRRASQIKLLQERELQLQEIEQEEIELQKAKKLSLKENANGNANANGVSFEIDNQSKPSSSKQQLISSTLTPAPTTSASKTLSSNQDSESVQSSSLSLSSQSAFPLSQSSEPISNWSLTNLFSPILFSLCVHMKLYPIIYCVSIVSHLYTTSGIDSHGARIPRSLWSAHLGWIRFAAVAAIAFFIINTVIWLFWGTPFLEETFLYHLIRKDHRHNFSPYFLPIYLGLDSSSLSSSSSSMNPTSNSFLKTPLMDFLPLSFLSKILSFSSNSTSSTFLGGGGGVGRGGGENLIPSEEISDFLHSLMDLMQSNLAVSTVQLRNLSLEPFLSFLPQFLLTAYLGWKIAAKDLVFAFALQTLAFVAWNKVCTSQYFMWFLWFLPVVLPSMRFRSLAHGMIVVAAWVGAQALWLWQAYLLEFRAQDTLLRTWFCSLVMLVTHAFVLISCVQAWERGRIERLRSLDKERKDQ